MEDLTDDEGVVRVQVNEIVSNIGTRGSGERLRNYVLNLLNEGAERVVLEFTDTGMSSSSFADEVGGGLAQTLGVELFQQQVAFTNLGDDEASVFQRGIEGRMRPQR